MEKHKLGLWIVVASLILGTCIVVGAIITVFPSLLVTLQSPQVQFRNVTPTFQPQNFQYGLIAYYLFNGNANDESGNGNRGVAQGATLTEDRLGNPNSAYHFNGIDDCIIVPDSSSLQQLEDELSVTAWIRIDTGTTYNIYDYRHVIAKGATYGDLWADYAVGLSNPEGDLLWEYSNTRNTPVRLNGHLPIPQSMWHHIAVTFKHGTIHMYIDGEQQERILGPYTTLRNSSQPMYIGCRYEHPLVGSFSGSIDELRLYNRALSESEVRAIYESQQ
jgi:hypothetical protein